MRPYNVLEAFSNLKKRQDWNKLVGDNQGIKCISNNAAKNVVKKSKAWEIKEDLIFYLLWLLIDYKAKVSQQASYCIGIFRGKADLNMKNNNSSCESSKITVNIFGKILKKNMAWMAVVFVFVFIIVLIISHFVFTQNRNSKSKAPTILANNFEYTICRPDVEAGILKACGLPTELSQELVGAFVGYLVCYDEVYYHITEDETEIVMYEYNPEPSQNVYVVQMRDIYCFAIKTTLLLSQFVTSTL